MVQGFSNEKGEKLILFKHFFLDYCCAHARTTFRVDHFPFSPLMLWILFWIVLLWCFTALLKLGGIILVQCCKILRHLLLFNSSGCCLSKWKKMMWCCFFFHLERNSVSACCYLCSTDGLKEYFLQMMDTAKSICCTVIWCSHNHLSYPFLLEKVNRNILISKRRATRLRNMKKISKKQIFFVEMN